MSAFDPKRALAFIEQEAMSEQKQYKRLEPPTPTPPDEFCDCADVPQVYLAFDLTENPLHCGACRRTVAPERIAVPLHLVDAVADWTITFGSLYRLWLQSGAYEEWAFEQLGDAGSPVNREGLEVARALSADRPCAYLWFWIEQPPESCPNCGSGLAPLPNGFRCCPSCHVYV